MSGSQRPRGLPLPFVLLALLLIASVSAIAIPRWFERPAITLDAAARLLIDDIEEARSRADFLFRRIHIRFDEDGGGYAITDEKGHPEPAPIGEGSFERDYDRDAVFRAVRVESAEFEDSDALEIKMGGMLRNSGRVVLSFQGEQRTVCVDAGSQRAFLLRDEQPAPAAR